MSPRSDLCGAGPGQWMWCPRSHMWRRRRFSRGHGGSRVPDCGIIADYWLKHGLTPHERMWAGRGKWQCGGGWGGEGRDVDLTLIMIHTLCLGLGTIRGPAITSSDVWAGVAEDADYSRKYFNLTIRGIWGNYLVRTAARSRVFFVWFNALSFLTWRDKPGLDTFQFSIQRTILIVNLRDLIYNQEWSWMTVATDKKANVFLWWWLWWVRSVVRHIMSVLILTWLDVLQRFKPDQCRCPVQSSRARRGVKMTVWSSSRLQSGAESVLAKRRGKGGGRGGALLPGSLYADHSQASSRQPAEVLSNVSPEPGARLPLAGRGHVTRAAASLVRCAGWLLPAPSHTV